MMEQARWLAQPKLSGSQGQPGPRGAAPQRELAPRDQTSLPIIVADQFVME